MKDYLKYSLSKLKRPTNLYLLSEKNNFAYLDEKIFEPFLSSNILNNLSLYEGSLNCSDCRNNWLLRTPYHHKIFTNGLFTPKYNLSGCNDAMAQCSQEIIFDRRVPEPTNVTMLNSSMLNVKHVNVYYVNVSHSARQNEFLFLFTFFIFCLSIYVEFY